MPALAAFVTRARLEPYDVPSRRGELKNLLVTESPDGELMLRFVLRSQEPVTRIRKHLPALQAEVPRLAVVTVNLLPEHRAVLEGEREVVLTGEATLPMRLATGVTLQLGPRSFFQTNTPVAEALYEQARAWVDGLPGVRTVWDLYCGVGGFALHLASPGREVLGVEVSADAVAAGPVVLDGGLAEIDVDHAVLRGFVLAAQLGQRRAEPGGGGLVVVEVALQQRRRPRAAQGGEALVEAMADLAELGVGPVAQGQHGEARALEARGVLAHEGRVEAGRALRRLALAPGADDRNEVLGAGEVGGRGLGGVEHAGGEAQAGGVLLGLGGERLGVAGLGGEQDGQRLLGRRRRRGGGDRVGRLDAGEEAAEPAPLHGGGAGDHAVQHGDGVGGERRVVWQPGGSGHLGSSVH